MASPSLSYSQSPANALGLESGAVQRSALPKRWLPRALHAAALLLVFGGAVEVTARIDDRLRSGVPLLSSPDRVADLVVQDALGVRGRPNGEYKVWQLNSFGFRGEEISEHPASGCTRVMTLGASETFGLYESPGNEYPAQLSRVLAGGSCYEVVNGAIFGLTVPNIRQSWNNYYARFRPQIVTIYPSPSFYLAPFVPGPSLRAAAPVRPPWWQPRALDRARDVITLPDFIQRRRLAGQLAAIDGAHPADWFFETVPQDRLSRYEHDLTELVGDVKATGARVILITHAYGFSRPVTDPSDRLALDGWRGVLARPRTPVLLDFEDAARDVTRRVGAASGIEVFDLAGEINGRKDLFAAGDLVHFNDEGAGMLARALGDLIMRRDAVSGGTR